MIRKTLFSLQAQAVLAAVMASVLVLLWVFAIAEERTLLHDQAGEIEDAQRQRDRVAARKAELEQLLENHRENMRQIQYLRDHFLRQKDERVVAISEAIADLAQSHQIQLDQVKYDVSKSRNRDLDIYRATFPLMGRYRDIRAFIHAIENSDLFVMITRLEVEELQTFHNAIQASLTLATYFEGDAE